MKINYELIARFEKIFYGYEIVTDRSFKDRYDNENSIFLEYITRSYWQTSEKYLLIKQELNGKIIENEIHINDLHACPHLYFLKNRIKKQSAWGNYALNILSVLLDEKKILDENAILCLKTTATFLENLAQNIDIGATLVALHGLLIFFETHKSAQFHYTTQELTTNQLKAISATIIAFIALGLALAAGLCIGFHLAVLSVVSASIGFSVFVGTGLCIAEALIFYHAILPAFDLNASNFYGWLTRNDCKDLPFYTQFVQYTYNLFESAVNENKTITLKNLQKAVELGQNVEFDALKKPLLSMR